MTRRKRRNHSSAFKAKVALAWVNGEHALADSRVGSFVYRRRLGFGRFLFPIRSLLGLLLPRFGW